MDVDTNLKIVFILTFGLATASLLGYLAQKMKLSPILGYLLSGYIIGPYSPGFVADLELAEQLAEIGVILMMFGVGLHFKWQDLIKVKNVAVPGAIGQTLIAATAGTLLVYSIGWPIEAGILIGFAIGVASTVVLVRVLQDNQLLKTPQGHIAVGWLIVEDIFTVIALLAIPTFVQSSGPAVASVASSIVIVLLKFTALVLIMFTIGHKVVSYILLQVARTRSQELFTLTILAIIFVVATGSSFLFGTSLALGAFIAGMIIGQTHVKHQASANALPLKDAFVVIFFLSVGMLFNPAAIAANPILFIGVLAIILVIKPLTAFLIVIALRHPLKTAFTVAIALAQIGEFSFILSEQAMQYNLMPDEGYDVIVACALISISLNPLLFKLIDRLVMRYQANGVPIPPVIDLNARSAIVVGFGPIGKTVSRFLAQSGFNTIVIDRNVDTITALTEQQQQAIYGDASQRQILESAHIDSASLLVITAAEIEPAIDIIKTARQLNKNIKILARSRYAADRHFLEELQVDFICCESESMKAFKEALLTLASQKSA